MFVLNQLCNHLLVYKLFSYCSVNDDGMLRLKSFWGYDSRLAFFDIKVFNPVCSLLTHLFNHSVLSSCMQNLRRGEMKVRREGLRG